MPNIPEPGFLSSLPIAMSEELGIPTEFAAEMVLHALILCEPETCGVATAIVTPYLETRYGLTSVDIHQSFEKTSNTAMEQIKGQITSETATGISVMEATNASGDAAEAELILIAKNRIEAAEQH